MLTNYRMTHKSSPLTEKERSQYHQLIGQLNQITNITKPEFSFEVCYASTIVNSATVFDINKLNKVLKHIKSEKYTSSFPASIQIQSILKYILTQVSTTFPMEEIKVDKYYLPDIENWSCALVWNSLKIKRVVWSTLAVETLSMTDGCDIFLYNTNC